MDKKQCLAAICSASDKYKAYLADKNLLFVFQEKI